MRRPIRTRRLSIAAIVSAPAFVVVMGAEVRSLWRNELWETGNGKWGVALAAGWVGFNHHTGFAAQASLTGHTHWDTKPDRSDIPQIVWGFRIFREAVHSKYRNGTHSLLVMSLWPLLLLLLIAPVRWLIARPASAPAFPVITDAKQT